MIPCSDPRAIYPLSFVIFWRVVTDGSPTVVTFYYVSILIIIPRHFTKNGLWISESPMFVVTDNKIVTASVSKSLQGMFSIFLIGGKKGLGLIAGPSPLWDLTGVAA